MVRNTYHETLIKPTPEIIRYVEVVEGVGRLIGSDNRFEARVEAFGDVAETHNVIAWRLGAEDFL